MFPPLVILGVSPGVLRSGEIWKAFSTAQAQRAGDPNLSVEKFRTVLMEEHEQLLLFIMNFNLYIQL